MKRFLLLAMLTGCLQIEAEIEESCVYRKDVQLEGVDATTLSRGILVDDLSDAKRLLDYNAELEFARASITPTGGVTSLDFIEAASVAIEGSPVYGCTDTCASGELEVAVPTSATQYLSAESLAIQLTVTGEMPKDAWSVDVEVCVRGTASYTVAP